MNVTVNEALFGLGGMIFGLLFYASLDYYFNYYKPRTQTHSIKYDLNLNLGISGDQRITIEDRNGWVTARYSVDGVDKLMINDETSKVKSVSVKE